MNTTAIVGAAKSLARNAFFFIISAVLTALVTQVPTWHLTPEVQASLTFLFTAGLHFLDKYQYLNEGAVKMPF